MKIGIVHTTYLQKGGEDMAVEQECRLLNKAGVQVSQLRFNNPAGRCQQLATFGLSLFNPVSWNRMNEWLCTEKPDVVHIHNWHFSASPSIIHAARRRGIPVVLTLHNFRLLCPSATLLSHGKLFTSSLRGGFPWKAVLQRVYHDSMVQTFWLSLTLWLHRESGTWKHVDRYIVLTPGAREIFLGSGAGFRPGQLVIKPNCVPDVDIDPVERLDHFLFVGRLSEEKGITTLVRAFAGSPYRLVILGRGPLSPMVEEYARCYPNIIYKGNASRDAVLRESARCSAMVFPSIWYEGNPMTIIEALACGTPVIASGIGAMKDMITDRVNGLHFIPGDVADLRRKLKQWAGLDAEERRAYGEHAREAYLANYTPEKNIRQLLTIYRDLLENRRSAQSMTGAEAAAAYFEEENIHHESEIVTL